MQEQKKSIILYENVLNLIAMAPQLERCAVLYVTCLMSTAHSHTIVTEFSGSSCHSKSESPLLTALLPGPVLALLACRRLSFHLRVFGPSLLQLFSSKPTPSSQPRKDDYCQCCQRHSISSPSMSLSGISLVTTLSPLNSPKYAYRASLHIYNIL